MSTSNEQKDSKPTPRLVKGRLEGKMFLVPSTITVLGIFCGFLAILNAIKGNYVYATKCIALSFVLDGLDGRIARRLNATSEFGKEFDSLSDVIAFGVAPAILVYSWAFQNFADEFGVLVAFSLVACGATRLARFNVDTSHHDNFVGLPIPAAAAALASLIYMYPHAVESNYFAYVVVAYTLLLSFLMVSTIPFFSVKHLRLTDGNPRRNLALVAILVALAWYQHRFVIALLPAVYVFSGPVGWALKRHTPQTYDKLSKIEEL